MISPPPSDHDAVAPGADARACAPDALDLEAATWAARRRNGLNADGMAALQAWLAADPRHAAALEDMATTVAQVRQLSGDDVAALRRGLPQAHRTHGETARNTAPQPSPDRSDQHRQRGWRLRLGPLLAPVAVAVLVVAVGGGGWMGWERWQKLPTFEQAFVTERGQQIVVTLPDDPTRGSTLQLDTATRLEAQLFQDRREIRLQDGQALFSVHADKARPFHVWAGQLHIVVVGTRFSVRHTTSGLDAGRTVVAVQEGHVRVSRVAPVSNPRPDDAGNDATSDTTGTATNSAPVELVAGEMLVGDDAGRLGPVTRVSPAAIASWRAGRISFDHTPLAQALAEFERYRSTGLVIRDPAVASLPVGGSYSLQQFGSFAESLPLVLPVRLVPQGEVSEIVLRKP
ncbi:FecR domain-containing protein [Variovorax sp. H27-G14]|uniref:FecR family protein n=1 Tax=Variovorax sp. H27-G14 TaxID=3111914 RepID=UPI0038FC6322